MEEIERVCDSSRGYCPGHSEVVSMTHDDGREVVAEACDAMMPC